MRIVPALVASAVVTIGLVARARAPHLDVEPFPGPVRFLAAVGLLIVVLALTVFLPLEGLFGEPVAPDPETVPFVSLFAGHAILGVFLAFWWALAGFEGPASFLRLARGSWTRRIAAGIAAGLAVWTITIAAMAILATMLGIGGEEGTGESGAGITEVPEVVRYIVGLSPWKRALLVASAGVFEEAFFRSFLQTRGGLLLSTALFTMSHASYGLPFMLVGVFTVSLVLGLVFRAGGDVLPCMVAHGIFDAVQLFVILPLLVSGS